MHSKSCCIEDAYIRAVPPLVEIKNLLLSLVQQPASLVTGATVLSTAIVQQALSGPFPNQLTASGSHLS